VKYEELVEKASGFRAYQFEVTVETVSFKDVWSEIQVRTLLQDVWDTWQHPLYERVRKSGVSDPLSHPDLRRMRWISDLFRACPEITPHFYN